MSFTAITTVTILSIVSIVLHAIHLIDYQPNDIFSITAVVSTSLMFVLPWAKKFIPYVGEWLFILTSLTSLISQAMAFGKFAYTDAHDILLVSVIATVLGAFVGHYISNNKKVRHGNKLVNKIKMLFILSPMILYLLDAKIDPKPIAFDVLIALTLLCIPIYAFITFILITRTKLSMSRSYISIMGENVIRLDELFHTRRKPLVLLVSAIPLTTFSIIVAENASTTNIIVLALFVVALALEHINALYFD